MKLLIKTSLCLLLFWAAALSTNLPYAIKETNISENFEWLYRETRKIITPRQCIAGFSRLGYSNECYDADGIPSLLIVSSDVVSGGSGLAYATYDISVLNSINARQIEIEVHCNVTNNAGVGDSFIAPNARLAGSAGIGPGTAASRRPGICNQSVASANNYCNGTFPLGLSIDKDVDIAVELVGADSGNCTFYAVRYWDQ